MEKWVPIALVAVLLVGSGGGYFFASSQSASRISSLETQLASTQQELSETTEDYNTVSGEYATLSAAKAELDADFALVSAKYDALVTEHEALEADYASLNEDYTTLNSEYTTLSAIDSDYTQLAEDYISLQERYEVLSQTQGSNVYDTIGYTQMLDYYYQLNLDVRALNQTLNELDSQSDSYPNTLAASDILSVEDAVREAIGSSTDAWECYQKIHEYVTSNIAYVYDVEVPYISSWSWTDVNGVRYLTGFDYALNRNYIQKPSFTLEYKQGDCDDQAALEYAMIRYYNKYIQGTDYNLYMAWISFSNGEGHISVVMPVSGGKVIIFDPAGHYLTSTSSKIGAKDAFSEMDAYNEHWYDDNGGIVEMSLTYIDVTDGDSVELVHGTLNEVAAFLSGS